MRFLRWPAFVFVFSVAAVMLTAAGGPAFAANKAAAMVIDANTGRVLHDNAASEPRYPASLTKMMTLYMAFETIEAGRLSYASPLTVSERAAAAAPSKLGLDAGSTIPLRDAVKALIVKSANDMAVAIAEKIGGSEEAFARLMTKRARQLGMSDTTFRNASGLPDSEQVTTARDMLTLAMRLQDDFPQHYRLFTTRTFSYGGKTYRSHNALLGRFAGVDGIKTGYTRASGFNLVSSYRSGGKHVVAAVFGGVSAGLRDAHMRMLLARAIEKASTTRTRKAGPQLIAEARPATRPSVPKPATVPAPQPKPRPAAAAIAEGPPVLEPVQAETVAVQAEAPRAEPRISIAKVKTVSVLAAAPSANVAPPSRAITETAATSEQAPETARLSYAAAMPRPDFAALKAHLAQRAAAGPVDAEGGRAAALEDATARAAMEPPQVTETVLVKDAARGRAPSTLEEQLALMSQSEPQHLGMGPDDKPALQAAVAELPAPMPVAVSTGRSAQPSSQAEPRVPPSRVAARPTPQPAATAPATGFHVQIGVYSSPSEAERAMAAAQAKAAHVLADSDPIAMPLNKGERQLYRARFAGFDSAGATSACNELRRSGLDCFVARAN